MPHTELTSMPAPSGQRILPETILLWFLQVLGAVTAIIFGTLGILSWLVADQANVKSDVANAQSDTGNLVALVALCAQVVSRPDVGQTRAAARTACCEDTDDGERQSSGLAEFCNGVQIAAEARISGIASSIFGTIVPHCVLVQHSYTNGHRVSGASSYPSSE